MIRGNWIINWIVSQNLINAVIYLTGVRGGLTAGGYARNRGN